MSWSIIFDTKFVNLSDGRLLHLDRSGCNNDDAGRKLSDYIGKIYTKETLIDHVSKYMKNGKREYWELKIGSNRRPCTYYEYGEHLLRMAKRARNYNDFNSERCFYARRIDGISLYKPEEKTLSLEEFDKCFYTYLYSGKPFRYSRIMTRLNNEAEIVDALDSNKAVEFYVGKTYKCWERSNKLCMAK